jgi:hypothetical protein
MKIQNMTSHAIEIGDVLSDSVNQYQSGIKRASLAPNGSANDTDKVVIADTVAGESAVLAALLADGSVMIVGGDQELGGNPVPGVLGGKGGGPAFAGVVKTVRAELAAYVYRIMFGVPVAGDQVVDLVIPGYDVAATADVIVSADAAANLSGTVTNAKGTGTISGNVIVTFTGSGPTAQAGYMIFAKLA